MKFDSVKRENTLSKRDSVLPKGTLDCGFISRKIDGLFSKYDIEGVFLIFSRRI
jgi:hypothetical protein